MYLGALCVLLVVMAPIVGLSAFTAWDAEASTCEGIDLEVPHYTFGFHLAGSSGAGQDRRAELFAAYASGLSSAFTGLFEMPAPDAWAQANEIVEGSDVSWAYIRATSPSVNTYRARPGDTAPADLGSDRTLFTARGSC